MRFALRTWERDRPRPSAEALSLFSGRLSWGGFFSRRFLNRSSRRCDLGHGFCEARFFACGFIRVDDSFARGLVELALDRLCELAARRGCFFVKRFETRLHVEIASAAAFGSAHPFFGCFDVRHEAEYSTFPGCGGSSRSE